MRIELKDLLALVHSLQSRGTRIGVPDDPTPIEIADLQKFVTCLDVALRTFRNLRGIEDFLVGGELKEQRDSVWIRFVHERHGESNDGEIEPELKESFGALREVAIENGGDLHYWGGNNYFSLSLPFENFPRKSFPDVYHLPWNERYAYLLKHSTWGALREKVFRFSEFVEPIIALCRKFHLSRVLVPSVGLCVHPWLFASRDLSVVATEKSQCALETLSAPEDWPRLYSWEAYNHWDIEMSALFAKRQNPHVFPHMPRLEDQDVIKQLRKRITFTRADWKALPLENESVDAIFATNGVPRTSTADQTDVLGEWHRVIRKGGFVFIAQHNFFHWNIEPILLDNGWFKANLLRGEHAFDSMKTTFQVFGTSG